MREASFPWQSGSGDLLLFKFKAFAETFLSKQGIVSVCEVPSVRNTIFSQKEEENHMRVVLFRHVCCIISDNDQLDTHLLYFKIRLL